MSRYFHDLPPDQALENHLAEAHHHILRARDIIYGTFGTGPVKRGWYIRSRLDKINTLLFKIQRQNRKEE